MSEFSFVKIPAGSIVQRDIVMHCTNYQNRPKTLEGNCRACLNVYCKYNITPIGLIRGDDPYTKIENETCGDAKVD